MSGRRAQAHAVPRFQVRPDAFPERSFPRFEQEANPDSDFLGTSELCPRLALPISL